MKNFFENFGFGTLFVCIAAIGLCLCLYNPHAKKVGTEQYSPLHTKTNIYISDAREATITGDLYFNRDSVTDSDIDYALVQIHKTIILNIFDSTVEKIFENIRN